MRKAVEHKLTTTRGKVSKHWATYRLSKQHIKKLKRLGGDQKRMRIASELDLTRQTISKDWTTYREAKHAIIYKSPYAGFNFVRTLTGVKKEVEGKEVFFKFHDTKQKIYKAKRGFNIEQLDDVVPRALETKHVQGVLLVFEIYNPDEDTRQTVSNYINREEMVRIQELEETVEEYIIGRFQGYGNYQLKFIYMRIIYAKA